jgi:hypothetical protein
MNKTTNERFAKRAGGSVVSGVDSGSSSMMSMNTTVDDITIENQNKACGCLLNCYEMCTN